MSAVAVVVLFADGYDYRRIPKSTFLRLHLLDDVLGIAPLIPAS
jgi:hypothetical protein